MAKVRRIDFSPDEFLVGVWGLSDAACGIYWKACALIYSHGGPIPLSELRRWCSTRRQFDAIVQALIADGKLISNGAQIDNKRCSNELQNALKRSSNWAQNGLKGGRPPKENNDIEKPSGLPPRARAEPSTINHQLSEEEDTPQSPPSRGGGRRARSSKLSPREVQARAFYEVANEIERERNRGTGDQAVEPLWHGR